MRALRRLSLGVALITAVLVGGFADPRPGVAVNVTTRPTIVLVHGAWADASGWNGVIERLEHEGYPVIATANPLRSLAGDAASLSSVLASIPGPVVVVGHSYGGAVATNGAAGHPNVRALVYIAAFAPDAGESITQLVSKYPGSKLAPAFTTRPLPPGEGAGVDLYIDPAQFHDVFVGDASPASARLMAAGQRPLTSIASSDKTTVVAWKTIPSWYLVARQDQAIPPDAERFMAQRAGSHTVETDGSHAVMVAHPGPVTDLIIAAAKATY